MQNKKRSGVTLVELMIAVLILVIAVVPIYNMYMTSIKTNALAHKITLATFTAQQKIEEFVGLGRDEIIESTDPASGNPGSAYNLDGFLGVDNADKRLYPDYNGFDVRVWYNENVPLIEQEAALITIFVEVLDANGDVLCNQSNIINVNPGGI